MQALDADSSVEDVHIEVVEQDDDQATVPSLNKFLGSIGYALYHHGIQ